MEYSACSLRITINADKYSFASINGRKRLSRFYWGNILCCFCLAPARVITAILHILSRQSLNSFSHIMCESFLVETEIKWQIRTFSFFISKLQRNFARLIEIPDEFWKRNSDIALKTCIFIYSKVWDTEFFFSNYYYYYFLRHRPPI